MKNIKTPRSIKILYWLTNFVYGLILLVGLGVIAFNILVYTSFFGDNLQMHMQFPVKVNFLEKGDLYLNNTNIKVEFVEATSQIHIINTPLFIARKYGSAMLIAFLFLGYIFYLFQKFMKNVKNNIIFESDNIMLLRNIAYGLLGLWLYAIIYSRAAYGYIANSIDFEHVEILEDYRKFPGLLLLALFIWVISHVFLVGVKLKEEQDLTI